MNRLRLQFLMLLFAIGAMFCCAPVSMAAGARSALVIGNSAYSFAPLANPGNDASDVAKSLREAGFEVTLLVDADRDKINAAIVNLGETLNQNGGVGLFFFAGHGVQVSGENYLLPIGDGIGEASELAGKTISAAEIVEAMSGAGNELNIIILDACRDNPLTGGTGGLSRIDSSASLFVSYSTSPGAVALDGTGRNSPYAKHLTLSLATPNLNLEETFKRTLKGVYQETEGKQTPWLSSSFFGEFVFKDEAEGEVPAAQQAETGETGEGSQTAQRNVPDVVAKRIDLNGVYKVSGSNPDGSRYRGMLALRELDNSFDFTWWIGKDVFHGTGELAGRMLVVNWNDVHPVVYTFEPEGVLDGEWADGTATDRLQLFGIAVSGSEPQSGLYQIEGRGADGTAYNGSMQLSGAGENWDFNWTIGESSYQGSGKLQDGIMVVDWGGQTPIVYSVDGDGVLHGLWDGGLASETATPQ